MSDSERNYYWPTVTLSFALGTLAGATLVLLLAPKARREYAERTRELSNDLKERGSATIDTARDKVSSVVSQGRHFVDEQRSVIESAVGAGKAAYAEGRSRAHGVTSEESSRPQ